MKKLTKVISLILLLSFTVLLCVGCGGGSATEGESVTEKEFSYSVAYAESYNLAEAGLILGDDASSDGFSTELIKSYNDLVSYSTTLALPFYDTGSSEYDSTLSQQVRTYDSAYFEDSALVFVYAYQQTNQYTQTVRVEILDECMNIVISLPGYVYDGTEEELVYVYIVEVSQVGLDAVTNIEIIAVTSGYMYSLYNAYNLGLLTADEVASIAYYYYDGKAYLGEYTEGMDISLDDFEEYDYEPIAIDPVELDEETELAIKTTCLEYINAGLEAGGIHIDAFSIDLEDIIDFEYYGTYGDVVAFMWHIKQSLGSPIDYLTKVADTVIYYRYHTDEHICLWIPG